MYDFCQVFFAERTQFIESSPEQFYMFFRHGDTCCHGMPAISGIQLFAFTHFFKHGVGFNRTSRTFHTVFCPGQHKNRTVIPLPDSSGDDSGQAFMAVRQIDYQHPVFHQITVFNQIYCLGKSLLRQFFSLVIQFF